MSENITSYVAGFVFCGEDVALIRKNKPSYMAGKLNGIGGKLEATDRDVFFAMTRELEEEAGLYVPPSRNICVAVLKCFHARIYFFKIEVDQKEFDQIHTCESEAIVKIPLQEVRNHDRMRNLDMLISIACDETIHFPVHLNDLDLPREGLTS